MNAPSAVRFGQVPEARVLDNSRQTQQFASIGREMIARAQQSQAEKKARGLANDLMKDPQAALETTNVNAAEQQQIEAIQNKAEAERQQIVKTSNMQRIIGDPENKAKLIELMQLDHELGKQTLDIMSLEDQQQKAQFAAQMKETNDIFNNAGVILQTQGKEGLDSYLMEVARPIYQQGGDVSKLLQLKQMGPDEAAAQIERNRAMTGSVLQVPEVQKAVILSDGAEMRDQQGNLLARNEKDVSPNDAANLQIRRDSNELRRQELDLKRNKIPTNVENNIVKAQEMAFQSRQNSGEMQTLAEEFENQVTDSGQTAKWRESLKTFMGSEDAVSVYRKKYNKLKNAQVMKSLPAGPASDKDIAIAQSGFLSESANPKQVAAFLRGTAKMESLNADFQEFRSQYMSDRGSAAGLTGAWKEFSNERYSKENWSGSNGDSAPIGAQENSLPQGVTEADIQHTMQKHGVSRDEVLKRIGG